MSLSTGMIENVCKHLIHSIALYRKFVCYYQPEPRIKMKFVVSYPQTNWDYAKFRFERIVKGKDRSNEVFRGEPGGKTSTFGAPRVN